MSEPQVDTDLIDEAALALMFLTLQPDDRAGSVSRAWKSFDWAACMTRT